MIITLLFFFWTSSSSSSSLVSCFTQKKFSIHDLETKTEAEFAQETDHWSSSVTTQPSSKYSDCNGTLLLAGYNWKPSANQRNESLSRLYIDLPAHKTIVYSFTFWALDSWDKGEGFHIQFDNLPLIQGHSMAFQLGTKNLCGGSHKDLPGLRVFGRVPHTSSSLTLKFISNFSQNTIDESFAIRDINLLFTNSAETTPYICGFTENPNVTFQNQPRCECEPGKYYSSTHSDCISCSKECASCYGKGADKCYQCAEGSSFNGKTCFKCDSSCADCSGPEYNQCTKCPADFVLFKGVCISSTRCSSPFTLLDAECHSPCSINKYSSWDEDCYPSCPDSSLSDLSGRCKSCKSLNAKYFKATDDGHQYTFQLSPSTCDLTIENVRRYLTITEQTPNSIGSFSFQVTKTSANNYLINLLFDESVLQSTSLDLKLSFMTGSLPVPRKFIPDATLKAIAAAVPAAQTAVSSMLGGSFAGTLALGATASLWSIASFQQFIGYFLYINVEYPFQTELFFSLLQISPWDYLPNPILSLTKSFGESIVEEDRVSKTPYDPPEKFLKYDWTSFFIENGGTTMALNWFLLILLDIVLNLKKLEKLKKNFILVKIKVLLKWNFIGRTFLESAIPLSLAVFLQLRVLRFDHPYVILCICFALLSTMFIFGMTLFFARSLFHRENEHLNKGFVKRIFGTFYEGISLSDSGLSKYYNLIILVRGIFITFLVTFLQASPLFQIIPLMFFNGFLIYFTMKHVRFEARALNWIVRLKEILILLSEFCVLFLCAKEESEQYYQIFGYLIVFFLGSAFFIEIVYMLVLQIYQIKEIGKKLKNMWKIILLFLKQNKHVKVRPRRNLRDHTEQPSEIICIESIS